MFGAKTQLLNDKGREIKEKASEFDNNSKKIFEVVNEMVVSDYSSPEAVAIANEIRSYQDDLIQMRNAMSGYGDFCINASNLVINNQNDIMSRIK